MRKMIFSMLMTLVVMYGNAQITVYARFTLYNGALTDENIKEGHAGQILLTAYSGSDEQTLNIGSQSTGAGAGKVNFNPVTFSKPVSVNSPQFFSMMAAGMAIQKVEFLFYNNADKLVFQETLKLVAFKSIAHTLPPCVSPPCPGTDLTENISMQYGGKVITIFPLDAKGAPGKAISIGWNRIKNTRDDDPNSVIQ